MAQTDRSQGEQQPDAFAMISAAQTAMPEGPGVGALTGGRAASSDRLFIAITTGLAGAAVATFAGLVLLLIVYGVPSVLRYGLSFLTTTTWDPVFEHFGAGHFIYGTLVTSAVALLIATPLGVGAA